MAEFISQRFSNLMDRVRGRQELGVDELKEEKLSKPKSSKSQEGQHCNICLTDNVLKLSLYLCYVCEVFLCDKCFKNHDQSHNCVKRKSRESERGRLAERLVTDMRKERTREESVEREKVEVFRRIEVKHGFDKDNCYITGLCGLHNKMWVVLDSNNYCMKIFSPVTNMLLRYVWFGSFPWDVTEIQQKFTDSNSASGSKFDVSGAARGDQDKHCLLAVTFPWIKQIWFIDVNQTPAIKTKTIEMQKQCRSIDFSEDKIFTLCEEDVGSEYRYSVDILSAEGNPLKVIQLDLIPVSFLPDLAVYKHKIYVTDYHNNKVLCLNMEDEKTISELSIEGSRPAGICVDPSDNVFVCGLDNNKVYKLSPDLRAFEPLNLDTDYTDRPDRICFTNGKLFFIHFGPPSLNNIVTKIQLQ